MISTIVLTKNEEKSIEACLKTLKWCDEVIVIDDYSEDKTPQMAEKLGAKVMKHHLNDDFSAQRNFGLKQAKKTWVLFIDADEKVSPQLRAEIKSVISDQRSVISGYYLKREDKIMGKTLKHGETSRVRLLRLARKNAGKWGRRVDETWEITGQTTTLINPLLHSPHPTMTDFLKSINFKSSLNAQAFYEKGRQTRFWDWFKPPAKFIQNWILRLGFLDGMPGFIMALMMSFHSFLVRAKLYLLWKQEGGWGR
jgi:glycosyltransferase involved in cell wall biosynthesis